MGLDTVEIVLRIEETFSVDLPDDELGSVRTVGDLYALLLRKLDGGYACLSSRAFYRVRKAMVHVLGIKRCSVRPSSGLAEMLDRQSRPRVWKAIEQMYSRRTIHNFVKEFRKVKFLTRKRFGASYRTFLSINCRSKEMRSCLKHISCSIWDATSRDSPTSAGFAAGNTHTCSPARQPAAFPPTMPCSHG